MHNTFRTAFFVCAAAAGAGLVCAQRVAEGGIETSYGAGEGPRRESKSDFAALLQRPNATGTFSIPGPGVGNPTDPNISGDWSWLISVVADLPVPSPPQDTDKFYTGGELVFNVPFTSTNTSSTSNDTTEKYWSLCLYTWDLWDVAYPNALRQDNGSCLSMLSSECIAAIERSAASNHGSRRCSLPRAIELPECATSSNDTYLWSNSGGSSWYNASDLRAWEHAGGVRSTSFGDIYPHERGNITAYNYVGSLAWPVMASFRGFSTGSYTGGPTTAKMSCPRADTAPEGSIVPTGDGFDAGDDQGQDATDGQSDQEDGGDQVGANWLVLGSLLVVNMLVA